MATYNGAKYLAEQLQSLADQSFLPAELQVGDDGSTDGTLEILESFARKAPFPVTIVRNKQNLGCGNNFIATARRCSGEWVAFCDQDDVWMPQKLARCADLAVEGGPETLLIVHNATVTGPDLERVGPLVSGPFGTFKRFHLPPLYLAHGFREVFRRDPILLLPEEGRGIGWIPDPTAHDNWVSVMASLLGNVIATEETLAYYRRHDDTVTEIQHPGVAATTRAAMANHAGVYARESEAFASLADYLQRHASRNPEFEQRMRQAASEVGQYGKILGQRARAYVEPSRAKRFRILGQMVRSGAYARARGWRLGTPSLLKDLAFAVR